MDSGFIIKQDIIKINKNDTVESLKERLQVIEHCLYSDTIKSILITPTKLKFKYFLWLYS